MQIFVRLFVRNVRFFCISDDFLLSCKKFYNHLQISFFFSIFAFPFGNAFGQLYQSD